MPLIRVDDAVYDHLKTHAEPFADTPNSVLRRLLRFDEEPPGDGCDKDGQAASVDTTSPRSGGDRVSRREKGGRGKRSTTSRAASDSIVPLEDYQQAIIEVLRDAGGSLSTREVVRAVGAILESRLTPVDREKTASGAIRWESRVQFARLRLVDEGLMQKGGQRGQWSLAEH